MSRAAIIDNENILKSTITIGAAASGAYNPAGTRSGLLNPEQSSRFVDIIMDDSTFLKRLSYETRKAPKGTIDKLGVGSRLLRGGAEDNDVITGKEVQPVLPQVPYETKKLTLGTSITNDWYYENIEREGFEDNFINKIAEQVRVDILDLSFNSDEATPNTDQDYDFLKVNDGFIKQIKTNVVDASLINSGNFSDEYFYAAYKALPRKYARTQSLSWIMSHMTRITMLEFLRNRQTSAGDAALLNPNGLNPLDFPIETIPNFPDDVILLTDPKQFTIVWLYDMRLLKTTEGKEAIYNDKRFYAWHGKNDFIIKEEEACVKLTKVSNQLR